MAADLISDNVTHYSNSATATLDGHRFPYNVNSLQWSYTLNTASFDTLGGRVIQVLSTKIDTITLQGDAGSRTNLIEVYNMIKAVGDLQVETWQSSRLVIPSRYPGDTSGGWSFDVWVRGLPQMGWNVQTVTYPYSVQFEVDQDFSDLTQIITSNAIANIGQNIGFSPFTGVAGAGFQTGTVANPTSNNTTTNIAYSTPSKKKAAHNRKKG